MLKRPRRNRKSTAVRNLVQENHLLPSDFVAPIFLVDGCQQRQEIPTLPDVYRYSIDEALREVETLSGLGIQAIGLFPRIEQDQKDDMGTAALDPNGLVPRAIEAIKSEFPDICLFADVALDAYTLSGHDGIVGKCGDVENDLSVDILTKQSLVFAQAGIDVIAPSDMMDGRVKAIRIGLDAAGYQHVSICAYTAKYRSSFYGPYRDALGSHPQKIEKHTYQMDCANRREAMIEARLDVDEGADMLMVKPALSYLDVIADFRREFDLPVCAFHVTGEYAMIMAAGQAGCLNVDNALLEASMSIKRAGANFMFSYAAKRICKLIN